VTNRHDCASGLWAAVVGTVESAGKTLSQRVGVDEVREDALSVDLDHGQALSIPGLELRLSPDVDELEVELELVLDLADNLERTLAQVAIRSVIERDLSYGYLSYG
jgi:hypothetical protein